jgi:uncharacterized C2H2 Zn-finger protein
MMMTYDEFLGDRPSPYSPAEELEKLIAAGLGDVERSRITPDQYARAMRGEVVRERIVPRSRTGPRPVMGAHRCPRCGAVRAKSRAYCRECSIKMSREWRAARRAKPEAV